MKRLLAGGLATAMLLVAGTALAARGYTDASGDANDAPDIVSVDVAEATADVLTITVSVANYQSLPTNSWVNLWFDLDSDPSTGDAGDEALVRYSADGEMSLYLWNGSRLVEGSTAGVTGSFAAGALTLSLPRSSIEAQHAFGILAVSSRGQVEGTDQLIASDYAPDVGRSAFAGASPSAYPDPANDEDVAPDITSVRVSDVKSGWISFAVSTPNYAALPSKALLILFVDVDDSVRTGEEGAELRLTVLDRQLTLDRWNASSRSWLPDEGSARARVRSGGNVVTVEMHVGELYNTRRFGFSLLTADVDAAVQEVRAVDFAPDDGPYWRYTLANKPAVKLIATRLIASPARPRAGKQFTVGLAVTRSDTHRPIASGTVGCRVLVAGRKAPAKGRIAEGIARCTFDVPVNARGAEIRGTITVRSGGKVVSARFGYVAA